jgi:hypothetical protein
MMQAISSSETSVLTRAARSNNPEDCIFHRIIKSMRMRWAGHVTRMGKRNVFRLLVGKPEGKRPPGRPRYRWMDNIKMNLTEIGLVVWTGLVWPRMGSSGELF